MECAILANTLQAYNSDQTVIIQDYRPTQERVGQRSGVHDGQTFRQ